MDKIKEQIIESCVTEICKEDNKKRITKDVLDPLIHHIFDKMKIYLICLTLILILIYFKIGYIVYKIRNLQ